jgi:dienelactone hydrolase
VFSTEIARDVVADNDVMSISARFTVSLALVARLAAAQSPDAAPLPYETLFYQHDGLSLEGYFYRPQGGGPFPLVVYNHGSATPDEERKEWPAPFVARMLVPAGYAVLVPERRGYGRSEGRQFSEEIGQDRGPRFVARQRSEADDVNAAVEYLLARHGSAIDAKRIAVIGYSFGGIVTTLAASRSTQYAAVVLQAPGALNWNRSDEMRKTMLAAAARISVPTLCAVAENDATTESARELCAAASRNGAKTILKIYPPFTSGQQRPGNPPGHNLFSRFGAKIWEKDLLTFLEQALRPIL